MCSRSPFMDQSFSLLRLLHSTENLIYYASLMNIFKKEEGFTLLELVAAVAIVGLLTAGLIVAIQVAQRAGRDAIRRGDLSALQLAAEDWAGSDGNYPTAIQTNCPGAQTTAQTLCKPASPPNTVRVGIGTTADIELKSAGTFNGIVIETSENAAKSCNGLTTTRDNFNVGYYVAGDKADYILAMKMENGNCYWLGPR